MRRSRDIALALALITFTLSVPAALAAYLLGAPGVAPAPNLAPPMVVAQGEPEPAAQARSAAPEPRSAPSPVLGILYTRGGVKVDWNGVAIPVDNGTYAYLGGEAIETGGEAMGVLRLDDGSALYLCPGSRARLGLDAAGVYGLTLMSGTARFAFSAGREFEVEAGRAHVAPRPASDPASAAAHVGEVVVTDAGEGIVCGLGGALAVDGADGAAAGQVLRVPAEGVADPALAMPEAFSAAHQGDLFSAAYGAGDMPYLCRCGAIHEFAAAAGEAVEPGAPVPMPDVTTAVSLPPASPPVEPPGLPALGLAEPGPPEPFDPNVLPPPAAGPDSGSFTVAPALVPSGGGGGGFPVTPS